VSATRTERQVGISVAVAVTDLDKTAVHRIWRSVGWECDDADDEHDTEYVLARDYHGRHIGAGRLLRRSNNVEIDRLLLVDEWRGRGAGRVMVESMIRHVNANNPAQGCIYVEALKDQLGFFSLLGFEGQGYDWMDPDGGPLRRQMVYCDDMSEGTSLVDNSVGLHHTAIRVSNIVSSLAFYGTSAITWR
jgi:predicted GNAT family N-acyltransferase